MNQVINESIQTKQEVSTFSFFENNLVLTEISGGMNNNGWRRFRRNGIVPHVFFTYLRESGIIKPDAWVPEEGTTVGQLLEFLKCCPYESEQARSAGDYLFQQILRINIPSLSKILVRGGHA